MNNTRKNIIEKIRNNYAAKKLCERAWFHYTSWKYFLNEENDSLSDWHSAKFNEDVNALDLVLGIETEEGYDSYLGEQLRYILVKEEEYLEIIK